jgi:cell division protein FtsB
MENNVLKFLYWRIDAMQKEIEKLNKKNKKLKKIIKEINNYKIIENENTI